MAYFWAERGRLSLSQSTDHWVLALETKRKFKWGSFLRSQVFEERIKSSIAAEGHPVIEEVHTNRIPQHHRGKLANSVLCGNGY